MFLTSCFELQQLMETHPHSQKDSTAGFAVCLTFHICLSFISLAPFLPSCLMHEVVLKSFRISNPPFLPSGIYS